jgi:hypothetical protein
MLKFSTYAWQDNISGNKLGLLYDEFLEYF